MSSDENKVKHELHILLDNELYEKLEEIKYYYGIKNITEAIRLLITQKYRRINKHKERKSKY
jgi:hypothetical protein